MFGIGIWEILLIFLVALIVLGPDKMPSAARMAARFFRQANMLKNELYYAITEDKNSNNKNG